ncbi:Subtilisin DY [Colletotrichum viniferum]|nr:Subtilisin DY [Colletotrichum viniferum]
MVLARQVSTCLLVGLVAGQQSQDNADPIAVRYAKSYIVEFADQFVSEIFTGASVETADLTLESLLELPDIVNAWPNNIVSLEPLPQEENTPQAVPAVAHVVTGVDKVHEKGIYGNGVKIGVVGTGIWYNHDALGGGFGEGFKVAGGYDFVGDQYWPFVGYEKEPDEDPLDLLGHGTHVAGIIAGKTEDFIGVAPDATLYAYKVMFRQGSTDAATLIESFLAAFNDEVDIITSSIGGSSGWAEEAWAVVASRLVEQGIVVTISAANSGSIGPFYGSSGSSGKNVLAIASADAPAVNTTRASSFTSWGLLNDLSVKPDITAPGGSIYSTHLDNGWTDAYGVETLLLDTANGDKTVRRLSDLALRNLEVDVSLPEDFTLKPGEEKVIPLNFKNPESNGWDSSILPLYSGKILISGDNGDELSVPYAGQALWYFTFNLTLGVQDFPKIFHNIIWGTRQLRWDIFEDGWTESDWTYPLVAGENGYIGSGAYWAGSGQAPFFDPSRWDPDDTLSYPKVEQPRGSGNSENWWFGKLANGSQVALGNYTIRYAALKPFGDPGQSEDWATFTTPFGVLGQY